MALIQYSPFLFLTLLSLSFTLSTCSEIFSTTVLDITASLHPKQTQPTPTPSTSSSSSSFTLQLHPRHSLLNPQHKDHHSILLSLLDRDSARVNSITTKLQLVVTHVNESGLRPEDLSAPVTSGVSQGSGEYFARIGVGNPPQQFYVAVDTGSDVTWLQCKPCTRCYPQSDPVFDPSKSSSYGPLTCQAQQCRQLDKPSCTNDNKCQYEVNYGDGSFTNGDFITEAVSFGQTGSVPRVPIGCGHVNDGLFVGSAGILGLGGGPLSLTSQIKATSFSYCLVARGSDKSSKLEFNSPQPGNSVTTRLLRNPKLASFYYAGFTGVSVGGRRVAVPSSTFVIDPSGRGGILVDSGTAVTRLQTQAYEAVRDAFAELTRNLPRVPGGVLLFDTCYNFSGMGSVTVPTVSFEVEDGRSWRVPAQGYLIPVNRRGIFCFAMAPSTAPLSILGSVQQQGTRVSFDLANNVIGFSPNNC